MAAARLAVAAKTEAGTALENDAKEVLEDGPTLVVVIVETEAGKAKTGDTRQ